MYIKLFKLFIFLIFSFLITGCNVYSIWGSGIKDSVDRDLSYFSSVNTDTVANITITAGEAQSVQITGDDNIIPYVKTIVSNGVLNIYSSVSFYPVQALNINITMNNLESISNSGVGNIEIRNINSQKMVIENDGVGNIYASGRVLELNAANDGVGNLNLQNLESREAVADLSGVGDINIKASTYITINLNGIGNIFYSGNCSILKITDNGIGDIIYSNQ